MKILKNTILLFFCLVSITTCEKDDICSNATLTTPRMVVSFKDISNQENLKTVNNFRAQGVGNENILPGFDVVDVTEIQLPLIINAPNIETSTQFELYKDFEIDDNGTPNDTTDDVQLGNLDVITITYITKEVYVSPACGFKIQYENIAVVVEPDGDNWIALTEPQIDNLIITNESISHYNFFH